MLLVVYTCILTLITLIFILNRHQFRECENYRGQLKEDLPLGTWLKAITFLDSFKQNKNHEGWNQHKDRKIENFTNQEQNDQSQTQ